MEENNVITFSEQEVNDGKGIAIAMLIVPILFFLPLVMEDKKHNQYLNHYSNQVLLNILLGVAISIVAIIPILGWIVGLAGCVILFINWIMLLIGILNGQAKKNIIYGNIVILK